MTHIKQPFVLDSEPPYPTPDMGSPGWWSLIPGVGRLIYSDEGGVGYLLGEDADGRAIGEMLRQLRTAKDLLHLDARGAFTHVLAVMGGSYPHRVSSLRRLLPDEDGSQTR